MGDREHTIAVTGRRILSQQSMKISLFVIAILASLAAGAVAGAAPRVGAVQAHRSAYGTILFDRRGFVLYAFTIDSRTASHCSGSCAASWPPFLTMASRSHSRALPSDFSDGFGAPTGLSK